MSPDRIRQDMGRHSLEEMGETHPNGLPVVRRVLQALDREGIRYCHWKSNQHLLEGMIGLTDLDVLLDRVGTDTLDRIMGTAGYKRFLTTPPRWHPGLEDYVGFDEGTGSLVHLHTHHTLRMGEKHAKGYWLPWEELFLSTRVVQQPEGMYATHPDVEMIIFLVRAALKSRVRDRVLEQFGRRYTRGELETEYAWLKGRADLPRVVALVDDLLGERAGDVTREILAGPLTLSGLVRFRRASNPVLKRCRNYSAPVARLRRWRREVYGILSAIGRRYLSPIRPTKRTVPCGGAIVAFIGSDGSGKSTAVKAIRHWLSWKVDVVSIYHGSGDGPTSLLRWPLRFVLRRLPQGGGRKAASAPAGGPPGDGSPLRRLARRLRPVWALVLSLEKRRNLARAWRARNRGMVVICDRYPQNQVPGFNDGPLLRHWADSRSGLLRALSRWEASPYEWAEKLPPNLVIKMTVSPEVALARKSDMNIPELERRIATIRSLQYPRSSVVEIDGDAPLDEVLIRVKRAVWSAL
jgi:thymidylate kinase